MFVTYTLIYVFTSCEYIEKSLILVILLTDGFIDDKGSWQPENTLLIHCLGMKCENICRNFNLNFGMRRQEEFKKCNFVAKP